MSRQTLLSVEQRTCPFGIPSDPTEMAKHYVLGPEDLKLMETNGAVATDSDSLFSFACCGTRAKA